MLKALDLNAADTLRGPLDTGDRGLCSLCRSTVIAHCGKVKAWHWQHERRDDCDPWAEPAAMTDWHLNWQNEVPLDRREVIIGGHRADIVTPSGRVCEVQHSPLRYQDIEARGDCYGRDMLWIFDARPRDDNNRPWAHKFTSWQPRPGVHQWHWQQNKWDLEACRGTILLDRGTFLLRIVELTGEGFSGIAVPVTRDQVVAVLNTTSAELPNRPPSKPAPVTVAVAPVTPPVLHWRERIARGTPDDPPIWSPEQWAAVKTELLDRRAAQEARSDCDDH